MYVGGLLFYSVGMFLMAAFQHKVGVILFSWTAGVMYSTLFTMPYLLIARYHELNIVSPCLTTARNTPVMVCCNPDIWGPVNLDDGW